MGCLAPRHDFRELRTDFCNLNLDGTWLGSPLTGGDRGQKSSDFSGRWIDETSASATPKSEPLAQCRTAAPRPVQRFFAIRIRQGIAEWASLVDRQPGHPAGKPG